MRYTYRTGVLTTFAQKFYKQLIIVVAGLFIASMATMTLNASAAGTVVVTGDTSAGENLPGWLFNRDASTSSPYEFNNDAASIGSGSLYALPIGATASDKVIAENFVNAQIAEVNTISYDFKIGSGGAEADRVHFYMNVYANFGESDDDKFYDCRYNIVPTVGSTVSFTTVTFDPTQSYPVTTRGGASASPYPCPPIPADMDNSSPGSNIRVFALNVGDTGTNDVGLDGYLDNVVVNLDSDTTTYDFESEPVLEYSVNGGGHILEGESKKRKDMNDISFGLDVKSYNIGTEGTATVRFHNVKGENIDKTTFHASEITDFNYFEGNNNCEAAMNFTAIGSWNGEEGVKLVFRAGDNEDTVRVTLTKAGVVDYDSRNSNDFPKSDNCSGNARTHLDKGNIVITKYED